LSASAKRGGSGDAGEPLEERLPASGSTRLENGEALVSSGASDADICAKPLRATWRDKSFYFRGPAGNLNLRAQNLVLFNQMAEGVDDETWLYHLRRGDHSRWFREASRTMRSPTRWRASRNSGSAPPKAAQRSRRRSRSAILRLCKEQTNAGKR
jgi:hypothetical protein